MDHTVKSFRFLTSKAFFLSAVLHVAAGYIFIFLFPVLAEPHKPKIIFLGSILQKQDVNTYAVKEKNHQKTTIHQREAEDLLPELSPTLQNNQQGNASKPFVEKSLTPDAKVSLKSTFPIPLKPEAQNEEKTTPIDIDFTTPSYKPLRLKADD